MDAKSVAIIAVIAVAPLAIVLIFVLMRGYTIDLHMRRGKRRNGNGDDEDGG